MTPRPKKPAQAKAQPVDDGHSVAPRARVKRSPGRPPFVPTEQERKRVRSLAASGAPNAVIGSVLRDGIHEVSVAKHFATELTQGRAQGVANAGMVLYDMAVNQRNLKALKFFLSAKAGWRVGQSVELSAPDGKPLQLAPVVVEIVAGTGSE